MDANMSLSDFLLFLALSIPSLAGLAVLVTAPQWIDWLMKKYRAR